MQVLEIVMARSGRGLDYDALMSLSGLAFRTPPWPEAPDPDTREWLAAAERLDAALEGQFAVAGADGPVPGDEVLRLVAAEVDAGRPCAALGWGSVKDEWSVIAGYDLRRGVLAGHCLLAEPREAYETWPPALQVLVTVDGGSAVAPGAALAVIDAAHRAWDEAGRGRYAAWLARIRELAEAPGADHERAAQLLADSRAAGAAFIEALAAGDDSVRGRWLDRAGAKLHELVDALEARGGAPGSAEALALLADPPGRADWTERLQRMAQLEEDVATALRRSLTADFPPEEEDF